MQTESPLQRMMDEGKRKHRFTIELSEPRLVDQMSVADDGTRTIARRLNVKGRIRTSLRDDDVAVDGRSIWKLPVQVSVTFCDDAKFSREKGAFGFTAFWPADDYGGALPADPDNLTLSIALPESAASRLVSSEALPDLYVVLSGFTSGALGPMPGLGKYEWATKTNQHLVLIDCAILDVVKPDRADEESEIEPSRTEKDILAAIEDKLSNISAIVSRRIPQLLYIGSGILVAVILLWLQHK